jgi:hypothetical protein
VPLLKHVKCMWTPAGKRICGNLVHRQRPSKSAYPANRAFSLPTPAQNHNFRIWQFSKMLESQDP